MLAVFLLSKCLPNTQVRIITEFRVKKLSEAAASSADGSNDCTSNFPERARELHCAGEAVYVSRHRSTQGSQLSDTAVFLHQKTLFSAVLVFTASVWWFGHCDSY